MGFETKELRGFDHNSMLFAIEFSAMVIKHSISNNIWIISLPDISWMLSNLLTHFLIILRQKCDIGYLVAYS